LRAGDDLADVFAWKEERTLSQALTLQYDKVVFFLVPSDPAQAAIGKRVTIFDYPDGRSSTGYNGVELAYRTLEKLRQVAQGAVADNKRLGAGDDLAMNSSSAGRNLAVGHADAISAIAVGGAAI
jgi:hypothetical protein